MKRIITGLLLVSVILTAGFSLACSSESVRGISAGVAVRADVLRQEVEASVRAGDYSTEDAAFLNPVIDEIKSAAVTAREGSAGWETKTHAEQRAVAGAAIEQIGGSVERLSERDIGIESERGKKRLEGFLRQGRRAVAVLRIIEAALPQE